MRRLTLLTVALVALIFTDTASATLVNAIPYSQRCAANGVACLDAGSRLLEAELPSGLIGLSAGSVITEYLAAESVTEAKLAKTLLPIEESKTVTTATIKLNLAAHTVFKLTVEHTVEIGFENAPAARASEAIVTWTQKGAGPFPVTFTGASWQGEPPAFGVSEGSTNEASFIFYNGVATVPHGIGEPTSIGAKLAKTENLKDLTSASAARTNLGLGTAATQASTAFLGKAENLSDLPSAATAIENLNLVRGGSTILGKEAFGSVTTGTEDTAVGVKTLAADTSGKQDIAIGASALQSNTTGSTDVAVGGNALNKNTEGGADVAIGNTALQENTTGSKNVAVGATALKVNKTGERDVALGYEALLFTTVTGDTALGYGAMAENATGEDDVAVGKCALCDSGTASENNGSGSKNVAVGNFAGLKVQGSGNVLIGNQVAETATTASNELWIANTNTASPLVKGSFSGKTLTINGQLAFTSLVAESVITEALQAEAVTAAKIGASAVTAEKIGAEAVGATKIKNEAVTAAKIATNAVEAAKIKAEAVTAEKLAPEAVETSKIKLLAVTEALLGAESVGATKIKGEAVETAAVKKEAITEPKLGPEAVTGGKIKGEAVGETKLAKAVQEKLFKVAATYGARTERAKGTEFEPSATEPTQVTLSIVGKTLTETATETKVGGVVIFTAGLGAGTVDASPSITETFIVPAGKKWEVVTATNIEKIFSTYLTL